MFFIKCFINLFPNIIYNNKESENTIKSLKPKTTYRYDEIPTNLLEIRSVYFSSPI
jgi:hypothetical protein